MGKEKISWLNYMGALQQQSYTPEELSTEGMERILNLNQLTHAVFNHSIPWIYLLDYTSGKYLMISKSVKIMLGYDPEYFLNGGLDLVLQKYQAQHLRTFNEEIFPDRLKIMKQLPYQEHPNYVFTYNLQVKNKYGEYLNLLQRNCFVKSDEQGNPLLSFGVITNVTHYKSENPVIQLIEKIDDSGSFGNTTLISKKSYYLNKEDSLFSKRELEILKWTIEGLTHKEIADRLFLAHGTVLLHRKNMLKKSNTRNVAELVGYAFRNQLV